MDPLSDVLSLLKPTSSMSGGMDLGGDWSILFPRFAGIRFYAVISGQCWLAVEDSAEPVLLRPGDCVVMPRDRSFRFATDLALAPVGLKTVLSAPLNGGIVTWNGGGDFFGIGGYFTLAGSHADILLGGLPPVIHIKKAADQASLRWSVERMMAELREPQPGGWLIIQHLAHLTLVQALRTHLAAGERLGVGWLAALADPQMRVAIHAIHDAPAQPWTVGELADRVELSRSTFALRFKATVGVSPIEYLTRWRMLLAGDRLASSGDPIAVVALALGYESESAFSTAFKRVMGCSPRQYSQGRQQAVTSDRK